MDKKQELIDAINYWREQNESGVSGAAVKVDNLREELRQLKNWRQEKMKSYLKNTSSTMDLIFSPDDNGWYFQRFSDWNISQLFKTKEQALKAKKGNKLVWDSDK